DRILVAFGRFEPRQQTFDRFRPESGAHAAEMDEMPAAVDADEERAKAASLRGPAADDDLVASATFGLGPIVGACGRVGSIEPLRDNALERHTAGRLQHRVAGPLEMLDEPDECGLLAAPRFEDRFEPFF